MFVAALMLVSAQAAVQQPVGTPAASSTAAPAKPKKAEKICKTDDAESGSRMVKRTCLTAEEWQRRNNGMVNSVHSGLSAKASDH